MDWLSGRIAAKLVVGDLITKYDSVVHPLNTIIVENDEEGRPYISSITSELSISISHSFCAGLSVGVKGARGIGCDIELIKSRNSDFLQRFMIATEQNLWNTLSAKYSQEIINTAAWSTKEAAIKSVKSTKKFKDVLVLDLFVEPSENANQSYFFSYYGLRGKGVWRVYEEYVVSMAVLIDEGEVWD